jgi:hypothetical protein
MCRAVGENGFGLTGTGRRVSTWGSGMVIGTWVRTVPSSSSDFCLGVRFILEDVSQCDTSRRPDRRLFKADLYAQPDLFRVGLLSSSLNKIIWR